VSKSPAILFVAALLLAGCATTPTEPEEVISSPPATSDTNADLNWAAPGVIQPFPAFPAARPGARTARTGLTRPPTVTTWTSLNRWAAENKIGEPRLVSHTPAATYALGTASGTLVLDIGSREATWNGVSIQLGFGPQFIDDQVFVHGLDLQKNLEPLLSGEPPAFGNRIIVIDPGHGGRETGARSVLGNHYEKEFTLDWAQRLAPLLEKEGWQVYLTRTDDVEVSLSNRVAFAEAHHADLFISLHFNSAAPDDKPSGIETYCLTPTGMPSTLTRGWSDLWSQIFPNNAFNDQSLIFAVRLHTALLHETRLEDRGVCRARFIGVLRGQRRPAVLLEGAYLSNPREARLIDNPDFRQKLAEAIADALR
jgi:N-acetylmuramoyl-L-alanine amidase